MDRFNEVYRFLYRVLRVLGGLLVTNVLIVKAPMSDSSQVLRASRVRRMGRPTQFVYRESFREYRGPISMIGSRIM